MRTQPRWKVGVSFALELRIVDRVEIARELLLHRLARLAGLEPPAVALDDEVPQLLLTLAVVAGQAQPQPLPQRRLRVLADVDPLRAADELGDLRVLPRQRLGDLDAAATRADHAPARPLVRDRMVPPRRMERLAGEALAPLDVGIGRRVEKAGGGDEYVGRVGLARGRSDAPAPVGEARLGDLRLEADELAQPALRRDLLDVGLDLGLGREFARPVVVRLERELVLARQHVDEKARIGVVAPGAADLVRLLVHDEIDTGALQLLGHEQARNARADDNYPERPIRHLSARNCAGRTLHHLAARATRLLKRQGSQGEALVVARILDVADGGEAGLARLHQRGEEGSA